MPSPKVSVSITENHFWLTTETDTPLAMTVVHPPEDPDSALSFKMVKVHIKSPSEHTINLQHYPVEMQFEHELDLAHSYVRPALAAMGVPQKLMVSALLEAGQEHGFLKKVLDKLPKDEEYKVDMLKKEEETKVELDAGEAPLF